MASLREIRRKIKSVKSTQKITRAMKMVAAARMRRAQAAILSSRPFAVKLEEAVRELALLEVSADIQAGREVRIHPYFDEPKGKKACLILVAADKGLCGAFNTNVLRAAAQWLRGHEGEEVSVAVAGRKGREFLRRLEDREIDFLVELINVFPKISFAHAELIGKPLLERFDKGAFSTVTVLYNEFKSVVSQRVVEARLLPIPIPERAEGETINPFGFKFEPRREQLLEALLPRYVKARLYHILLESQAAELAARMNAMDSATKNAGELLDDLTLTMNRRRQAMITGEIAELVGGVEALAS